LPKHVRCEYNQHGPFCSYALATRLFSPRRGSVDVSSAHLHEATHRFPLSHTSRRCARLDQTTNDLTSTRHACRSGPREVRTDRRKRTLTAPIGSPPSTDQATDISGNRSAAPVSSGQDGSDLETGAFPCPGRRRFCGFHRELFCVFWKHTSKAQARKSKLLPETINLIQQMAANNRLWGAQRMRGRASQAGYSEKSNEHSRRICARGTQNEPVDRPGRPFSASMRQRCEPVIVCR
jgi:hypothetical protein